MSDKRRRRRRASGESSEEEEEDSASGVINFQIIFYVKWQEIFLQCKKNQAECLVFFITSM